jgi:hypothetical protein
MSEAKILSVSIERSAAEAYEFLSRSEDAEWLMRDLNAAKRILESHRG